MQLINRKVSEELISNTLSVSEEFELPREDKEALYSEDSQGPQQKGRSATERSPLVFNSRTMIISGLQLILFQIHLSIHIGHVLQVYVHRLYLCSFFLSLG